MCGADEHADCLAQHIDERTKGRLKAMMNRGRETWSVREIAEIVSDLPSMRGPQVGWIGYGEAAPGARVLIGVDSLSNLGVVDTFADVLRSKGCHVDVMATDVGRDRMVGSSDEVGAWLTRGKNRRRGDRDKAVLGFAEAGGYDMLLHGTGGPAPNVPYAFEGFPWYQPHMVSQGGAIYPQDVLRLINEKTWSKIWNDGPGGRVHLTDPEGTDISWTMHEEYFDGSRRNWTENPVRAYGHLLGHPVQPILEKDDTSGVLAGTISHFNEPFPNIRVHIKNCQVTTIEGGGEYGARWQELLEETADVQYPSFPRPGLFWLWEAAIGTNPWIARPHDVQWVSSGTFEWERRRSGVIHMGVGTRWQDHQELWAAEEGLLYGHLHVHLYFPTYEITTRDGRTVTVIKDGRLTALDDPEVRAAAAQYGEPDKLLTELWVPRIPGISAPGSYDTYADNPARWIYMNDRT